MTERHEIISAMNAAPTDRAMQLVAADWFEDRGEYERSDYLRNSIADIADIADIAGIAGIAGIADIADIADIAGSAGIAGIADIAGIAGSAGIADIAGIAGSAGIADIAGIAGIAGSAMPATPTILLRSHLMMIVGSNVMAILRGYYGRTVLIGTVASEHPRGWLLEPCWDLQRTNHGNCWIELAAGDNPVLRRDCEYGPPIKGPLGVPLGTHSLIWYGELPSPGPQGGKSV